MKNHILLTFMLSLLFIFSFGIISANAETCGDLTYYVSNGEITIEDCNTSAIIVTIPGMINGYPVTKIDSYAFYRCSSLTCINIPDSVTTIGDYAFSNCDGLAYIYIPDSVTEIGDYAFYDCSSLTCIDICEGVTTIGDYAFSNCDGLAYISIPDSVTEIGDYAFCDCSSLKNISLPDSVIEIGSYTFNKCSKLTSISIPDSVTTIGAYAFSNCDSLTSIHIPDSVTEIGENAFCYCNSLTTVTTGNSVTIIEKEVFIGCDNLTSISIGSGITEIRDNAFSNCVRLKKVNITDIKAWCEIDFESLNSNPLSYELYLNGNLVTNLEIPDEITAIKKYTFSNCSSLISVTIPDSVTEIGSNAFYNCISLTSVSMPKGVTVVGSNAFYNCNSLTKVNITDIKAWYQIDFNTYTANPLYYAERLYLNGELLTNLEIPEGITKIGAAFQNCISIENVTIPDGVTEIAYGAFKNCSNLESINFPDSITKIWYGAFLNCTGLRKVNITDIKAWCEIDFDIANSNPLYYAKNLYINDNLVTNLEIPEGTVKISSYAFQGCVRLTSVSIPDSVVEIGGGAFCGCSGLQNINIPDSVTQLRGNTFQDCVSLTSIIIPDNVTTIGSYAFMGSGLTSIIIPDSVTTIKMGAFYKCRLKSISIGSGVTEIQCDAFYDCVRLEQVNITDIKAWCEINFDAANSNPLYYAKNLYINDNLVTNLEIPEGTTKIGSCAFSNYSRLTSVIIPDSVTEIGSGAFSGCSSLTSVIIPDSVTEIGSYAFYNCSRLTSVIIPDSVTTIGSYAFYDCSRLTSIIIPDSVTEIGSYVFYNCSSLKKISIPDGVTAIGFYAFHGCSSLTSISIGNGVTTISTSAFYECSKLKYVGLSKEILYVSNDAFWGCGNIQTVFYEGTENDWNEILFYSRNENLTNATIICNALKKTYKFETNCKNTISDITDYAVFSMPTVKHENKTLIGWYDNKDLEGEPVTFPYYGSITTLYALWADRAGLSFDDAIIVNENENYTVKIETSGQIKYYEFVPKYAGTYRFYTTGSMDVHGCLYDKEQKNIICSCDVWEGYGFDVSYNMTEGETYYISVELYDETGTFDLVIKTCVPETETVCRTTSSGEKRFYISPKYLPENCEIILACYKDGNFVQMRSTKNNNDTIYFIIDKEFDTAKVMAWESLEKPVPLCEFEPVEL